MKVMQDVLGTAAASCPGTVYPSVQGSSTPLGWSSASPMYSARPRDMQHRDTADPHPRKILVLGRIVVVKGPVDTLWVEVSGDLTRACLRQRDQS